MVQKHPSPAGIVCSNSNQKARCYKYKDKRNNESIILGNNLIDAQNFAHAAESSNMSNAKSNDILNCTDFVRNFEGGEDDAEADNFDYVDEAQN